MAVAADDEEARILFRLLLAKGGKAVQQALPEIIRQSPAALGAERFVGADTVELLPAPDAPGKGKDHPPLLPPATQLVQLGRQGGWVEVGVVATGERGWLRQRQLAPMPQPSQPLP